MPFSPNFYFCEIKFNTFYILIVQNIGNRWATKTKNSGFIIYGKRFCLISQKTPKMLSKLQKASDKARLFFPNTALVATCFQKYIHMAKKTSSSSSKVQALYELCKRNFTPSGTPPPSSQAVHDLCSLLGISPDSFSF